MGNAIQVACTCLVQYQDEQLQCLRAALTKVRSGDEPEAVHDVRVASRRLHESLAVMGLLVSRERVAREQRSLRRLRRAFCEIRDLDVLMPILRRDPQLAACPQTVGLVEAILSGRRARACADADRVIRRVDMQTRVTAIGRVGQAFLRKSSGRLGVFRRQLGKLLAERATAILESDPRVPGADLHKTRIRVKRLRYLNRLLGDCGWLRDDPLGPVLTTMQRSLGDWSDQVAAGQVLGRLGTRDALISRGGDAAVTLLECAAARLREALEKQRDILGSWPGFIAALDRYLDSTGDCLDLEEKAEPPVASVPGEAADSHA